MIPDYHVHTEFSFDSEAPPEKMVEKAIAIGMPSICFTDHCDFDVIPPIPPMDEEAYFDKMHKIQAKYQDQIDIRIGVELGLQTHLVKRHHEYVNKYPFDFVIGSLHVVNGQDPYYAEVFAGKEDREVYQAYFAQFVENLKAFSGFQIVGHIDYVVRYGKNKAKQYSYQEYADSIDEILKVIIAKGLGIEVNTSGIKSGLDFPNPHPDVIKRYKELGGEIITLGSDAHKPEHVGYKFKEMKKMLKDMGFKYLAQFKQRKIEFNRL